MGTFFTNVQVLNDGEALPLSAIAEAVRVALADDGWRRADGVSDRTVVIRRAGDWFSIYDSEGDLQNGEHQVLAERISRQLARPSVAILVHDSDVVELGLFHQGKCLDRFVNRPDYFDSANSHEGQGVTGNAKQWAVVLRGKKPSLLTSIWDSDPAFAEEMILKLARLLGIKERNASIGFRHFDNPPANGLRLTFAAPRSLERPSRWVERSPADSGDGEWGEWEPVSSKNVSRDEIRALFEAVEQFSSRAPATKAATKRAASPKKPPSKKKSQVSAKPGQRKTATSPRKKKERSAKKPTRGR